MRGEDEGIKKKVLSAIKIGVMKIKLSENIFSFHRMNSYALLIFLILTFIVIPLQADEKKLRVMTTFTVIADIVKNVAGDAASVESASASGRAASLAMRDALSACAYGSVRQVVQPHARWIWYVSAGR